MYPGAVAAFDRAINADPTFALAYVGKARALQLDGDAPAAGAAMRAADALLGGADDQTASHSSVFRLMIEGRQPAALEAARAHLADWPRDALVLATSANETGLIALSGRPNRKQELVDFLDGLAPAYGDDPWFGAHHAMALSENGQIARARPMIERAIAVHSRNSYAAHAMAHVLYESAEAHASIAFLRGWLADYPPHGAFRGHLSWHLALIQMSAGDMDEADRLFDDAFAAEDYTGPKLIKLLDAASYLWRAELAGHSHDAARWRSIHRFAHATFPNVGMPFADWHAALADAALGDSAALREREDELAALVGAGRYSAGDTVLLFTRALHAYSRQDFSAAIDDIEAMLPELVRIGGSRAQLDLVEATLQRAYFAAGRRDEASRALARRRPGAMPLDVANVPPDAGLAQS